MLPLIPIFVIALVSMFVGYVAYKAVKSAPPPPRQVADPPVPATIGTYHPTMHAYDVEGGKARGLGCEDDRNSRVDREGNLIKEEAEIVQTVRKANNCNEDLQPLEVESHKLDMLYQGLDLPKKTSKVKKKCEESRSVILNNARNTRNEIRKETSEILQNAKNKERLRETASKAQFGMKSKKQEGDQMPEACSRKKDGRNGNASRIKGAIILQPGAQAANARNRAMEKEKSRRPTNMVNEDQDVSEPTCHERDDSSRSSATSGSSGKRRIKMDLVRPSNQEKDDTSQSTASSGSSGKRTSRRTPSSARTQMNESIRSHYATNREEALPLRRGTEDFDYEPEPENNPRNRPEYQNLGGRFCVKTHGPGDDGVVAVFL